MRYFWRVFCHRVAPYLNQLFFFIGSGSASIVNYKLKKNTGGEGRIILKNALLI
jgi:hypothetical protein